MKMAAKCSKNTTFLLLIVFALLLDSNVVLGWGRLSEEENLELDRQLQLINKPAIKSLQTKYGDIVDCIDINKQLAFDHPLLKNHAIQMKPNTIPKGLKYESSRTDVFLAYVANISCPPRSVPIKRTMKEDLIMDIYKKSARRKHPKYNPWANFPFGDPTTHVASVMFFGKIFGAKAAINIWAPIVPTNHYSRASIQIGNGSDLISAGWEVRNWNYSRLYISWKGIGTYGLECMNVGCPGFVQVNHKIALGSYLQPSIYNGHQYEIKISLYQDHASGNWWVMLRDQYIGYWPQELFISLANGATGVSCGGHVSRREAELSPAMGSGHLPNEGYRKSAFIKGIKVITSLANGYEDPNKFAIFPHVDRSYCYDAYHKVLKDPLWGHHVYYGGRGKCPHY